MVEQEKPFRIVIEVIPHSQQRYVTAGDWKRDASGNLHITVSDMGNNDYAFLVGIHELVEAWLCERQGVTDEAVTAFDTDFEAARPEGDESEPGDAIGAPYGRQHGFATSIERMMCAALNISWRDYENAVLGLFK